jgi:hypothetical protein
MHNPDSDLTVAFRAASAVSPGFFRGEPDAAGAMAVVVVFAFLWKEFKGTQECGTVCLRNRCGDGFIGEIGIE